MKKVYFAFLSCLITSYGIAQNTEFLKRVENKYTLIPQHFSLTLFIIS